MNGFFAFSEVTMQDSPLMKLAKEIPNKESNISSLDQPLAKEVNVERKVSGCPIDGNNGNWSGERGNSKWCPDRDYIPPLKSETGFNNPENKTWGEILNKYGIDGITFEDGEPDFSEVSKGTVEIEPYSDRRSPNFVKADIELAKQKGCTPEEVKKWREDNGYTWHECKDMRTMQKVPHEIHANITHSGGISESKKGTGEQ